MYIEISDRGTGKTNRLIQDLIKHLNESHNNRPVLIANSLSSLDLLKERIPSKYHKRIKFYAPTSRSNVIYDIIRGYTKYYFDEFYHIREHFFIENGYYCGSVPNEMLKHVIKVLKDKNCEIKRFVIRTWIEKRK